MLILEDITNGLNLQGKDKRAMKQKDKAKELFNKFRDEVQDFNDSTYEKDIFTAKQCAIICANQEERAIFDELLLIEEYLPDDIAIQQTIFIKSRYITLRAEIEKL